MKECNLNCYAQHEGYCCFNELCPHIDFDPNDCDAETNEDLVTRDEFESLYECNVLNQAK